jgi:hypothetical protein
MLAATAGTEQNIVISLARTAVDMQHRDGELDERGEVMTTSHLIAPPRPG